MTLKQKELTGIKNLSKRLVNAQKDIRILDQVKWDSTIEHDFFKHKGKKLPAVDINYYSQHPLPFQPSDKIQEFRQIHHDAQHQFGEYSAITRLLRRNCDEYMRAVEMLSARGTPLFVSLAGELYGNASDAFYPGGPRLSEMGHLLFDILTTLGSQLATNQDDVSYTADQARDILQARLNTYFHTHNVRVLIDDKIVSDASAGADKIKLSKTAQFSERELNCLEVHEGWVHVGTTLNGAAQPYCSFLAKGSPSCSVLQEGLAVLTEVVTFSAYPGRLRTIMNRVVALDKISNGADFLDIYRYFQECGCTELQSYKQSTRVFRGSTPTGGPFTKDLSYAKGLVLIYNFMRFVISQHRIDMIPLLFSGKLTLEDIPLLMELKHEGLLIDPVYLPAQFSDLSGLSAWLSLSIYFNKFEFNAIKNSFGFLLH